MEYSITQQVAKIWRLKKLIMCGNRLHLMLFSLNCEIVEVSFINDTFQTKFYVINVNL